MRILALTLAAFILFAFSVRAQDAQLKGEVKDTINQSIPANTVILLMKPLDSTMAAFTRTDAKGHFQFPKVLPGDYMVWISHPAFASYRDSVHLNPGPNDMGNIFLTLRSQILKEVIIKGVNPVRLKGDTVEYAADSFAVRPNATTEDLLKILPGFQVDKNGKITAQGQTVQKVLVDGEEFFSDDPTVATRNIAASAVDKVQVFDKKSDQAAFTGIDDGQQVRTVNLKLKNAAKNGYFGKLNGAVGSDGYYENTAAINLFEKKRKLAFFGVAANTGKSGLNWQDANNYGSSGLSTMTDGGDMITFFSGASEDFTNWSGTYNGEGVPTAWNFGAHYSNKWDDDKINLNGDYTYNQVKVNVTDNTISQLKLPDSTINNTNDVSKSYTTDAQHMLNAKYDVQLDSSSEVKITVQGKMRHKDTYTQDSSVTNNGNNQLLNQTTNNTDISGQNNSFNSTLLWQKKFHKKGRTLSLNAQENYAEINSNGYQKSLIEGYTGGVYSSADTTDQYKTSYSRNLTLVSKLTYTEPLFKNTYLMVDYGLDLLSGTSDKNAYNRDAGGKYQVLDSIYSNFYNLNILTNAGGLFFKKATKKYTYSLGTDVGYTNYHQDNVYQDSLQKRNFLNWYPKGSFSYKFSSNSNLRLYYYGSTTQPSLDQLQPVASNSNPLNIVVGNPDLKPSFTSRVSGSYNAYNVLSDRGIYLSTNYTIVNNAFSSRDSVDAVGKSYSQTVNVRSTQNLNFYGGFDFKWKKPDLHMGFNTDLSESENINFVNGQENNTKSGNYTLGYNINKSKDKVYSIRLNANATYNTSRSSIQASNNTTYWTYQVNGEASKDLPLKFLLAADADMNFRQKTPLFTTNTNTVICNVSLSKMLLKKDALVLKLTANDIFNQNTGFNRSIGTNLISQSTYTAIHRYFMFSVQWNFSKNGKPSEGMFF